ncbi:sulfotransferase [Thiohalobacter sp. IOR34]|uniref:sulfotransferase family protein n=1 Tax=Thiohalobacter sp. IOR34 TaxID=3057176 RepID=UPI0025B05B6A|nr:sulfotransferase [Thiohalobacter sp. IOR34]WJW74448.1 sulfotransferase [Thiohalobacter sp. IOR34]
MAAEAAPGEDSQHDFGRPLFIVGAARSGTTLLQYMLRSHPALSLPTAESHFIIPFQQRRGDYPRLEDVAGMRRLLRDIYQARRRFFDEDLHGLEFEPDAVAETLHARGCHTLPEVIAGIFQLNAEHEGKARWGDKTPYYILHLDTLLQMFPDAQVVHIVRDGRDCALSMLERRWDLQIFNTYHAGYLWDRYVRAGRDFGERHPECYFELRYEDLLDEPHGIMRSLCAFLDIEFSESLIEFRKSKAEGGRTPLLQRPLQKANQAKWRQRMSRRQIAIFEAMAGESLERFGYPTLTARRRPSRLEWFLNEVHIRLCRHYSRWRR